MGSHYEWLYGGLLGGDRNRSCKTRKPTTAMAKLGRMRQGRWVDYTGRYTSYSAVVSSEQEMLVLATKN